MRRNEVLHDRIMERAIYDRLANIARQETAGQRRMNLKRLCRSISVRFRLRDKEIERFILEMNDGKKWKIGEIKRWNIYFP